MNNLSYDEIMRRYAKWTNLDMAWFFLSLLMIFVGVLVIPSVKPPADGVESRLFIFGALSFVAIWSIIGYVIHEYYRHYHKEMSRHNLWQWYHNR